EEAHETPVRYAACDEGHEKDDREFTRAYGASWREAMQRRVYGDDQQEKHEHGRHREKSGHEAHVREREIVVRRERADSDDAEGADEDAAPGHRALHHSCTSASRGTSTPRTTAGRMESVQSLRKRILRVWRPRRSKKTLVP